jgi:SAM-dependent methyltransferase
MSWISHWEDEKYKKIKQEHFIKIDEYLNSPIKNILDIGCGIAHESIQFNKKYKTALTLLDSNTTTGKTNGYNNANSFGFYNSLDDLKAYFSKLELQNIQLHDIKDYQSNEKFDVICSYLSCGFHYPLDTYFDLIKKHMHKNTRLIFSLRKNVNHNCKIIHTILDHHKFRLAEIKI